jgi:hypothetical protein
MRAAVFAAEHAEGEEASLVGKDGSDSGLVAAAQNRNKLAKGALATRDGRAAIEVPKHWCGRYGFRRCVLLAP